jgi:hypothetical protein
MQEVDYKCEVCGRTCTQGELDPGEEDAVCRECKALREEAADAMRQSHTPGPWRVEITEQAISVGTENVNICVMSCADGSLESEKADAHLIAAAPALVEALEELLLATGNAVVWLDFNGSKEGELATLAILRKAMEPAKAALALARGGAK